MPLDVNIDDNNATLVQYEGAWSYIDGSTRQWEGGIHSTGQAGSRATFNFRGYQVWVWGTIPAGSGTNLISVAIDGNTSTTVSRTSNGSAVYGEVYFASPLLRDTSHSIVVTNQGSTSSGYSEFMLDRFEFQTDDNSPTFPPFSSTVSSAMPSSTSSPANSSATARTQKTPWSAIIGVVASFLSIVIIILLFILWRKKRSSKVVKNPVTIISNSFDRPPLTPTPFPAPSEILLPSLLSEKNMAQRHYRHDLDLTTSARTGTPSSSALLPSNPARRSGVGSITIDVQDYPPPSYQPDPLPS